MWRIESWCRITASETPISQLWVMKKAVDRETSHILVPADLGNSSQTCSGTSLRLVLAARSSGFVMRCFSQLMDYVKP